MINELMIGFYKSLWWIIPSLLVLIAGGIYEHFTERD